MPCCVINYINNHNRTAIPANAPLADGSNQPFYDTNDDNSVSSIDALLVINAINNHATGEGEAAAETVATDSFFSDLGSEQIG